MQTGKTKRKGQMNKTKWLMFFYFASMSSLSSFSSLSLVEATVREERSSHRATDRQEMVVNGQSKTIRITHGRRGEVLQVKGEGLAVQKSTRRDVPGQDIPGVPRPPVSIRALCVEREGRLTVAYRSSQTGPNAAWWQGVLTGKGWVVTPLSDGAIWAEQEGKSCYIVETRVSQETYTVMVYAKK